MSGINLVVLTREYPIEVAGTKRVQHLLEPLLLKEIEINVLSLRSNLKIEFEKGIYKGVLYTRIGTGVCFKIFHFFKIIFYYMKGICSIIHLKQ